MKTQGFTLIEIIVVMAIVAIMAGIMVPFVYRIWEGNEIELTKERMLDLKRAMVGDPRMIQNGIRTSYGYVGDNGQLPPTISNALFPYMPAGYDPNNYNKDAWGNPFEYIPAPDSGGRFVSAAFKSYGPDGKDNTSDDIVDQDLQITPAEVTPTGLVQGNLNFVFTNATALPVTPVYSALITAAYIGGSGTTGCMVLNIGQINPGESKPLTQSFSGAFPAKLPVGKAEFVPTLYSNSNCTGSGMPSTNSMAVFISDGVNIIFVNLPTINYNVP